MNFNSIMIGTENPQRLKDYYTKLFGKPTWDDGSYFSWQLGTGVLTVGSHDQVKGQNREPGRILWNIETAGATVVKEPYDPAEGTEASGMLITTFSDPDNNYFQLMSPMDVAAYEKAERMAAAKR